MTTLFNVGDEIEITLKGKIDGISIGMNGSKEPDIRYGVRYAQINGRRDYATISEDELLKLVKVKEENDDECNC